MLELLKGLLKQLPKLHEESIPTVPASIQVKVKILLAKNLILEDKVTTGVQ
jgi:hypothetical protein